MPRLQFPSLFLIPAALAAQPYTISTIIGGGPPASAPARAVAIDPEATAVDTEGNLYFSDALGSRVWKLDADGILTLVAGNGSSGYSGDGGPATSAALNGPAGLAVGHLSGAVYIADSLNNRIRKVSADGTITTVAGTGVEGFSGDGGPAVQAQLNWPLDVAVVEDDGNVFIADTINNAIRRISEDGTITTIAGRGTEGLGDGGPAVNAQLSLPSALAADIVGNLYIADGQDVFPELSHSRIRRILLDGTISTIAGNGTQGFSGDGGPAVDASLANPSGVAVDIDGNVYIADGSNARLRVVSSDGIITTIAGTGEPGFSGDGGPAENAQLSRLRSVAVDRDGVLYLAESLRIRSVSRDRIIDTVAGNGTSSAVSEGGPASEVQLGSPRDVEVDAGGNLYIADLASFRVFRVSPRGIITTVAGNGKQGCGGDNGPATSGSLYSPYDIAVDFEGNLFIADYACNVIRKVAPDGTISRFAGTGVQRGYSGDEGPATSAQLAGPTSVAVDRVGNVYIADYGNFRIRQVGREDGVIRTIAGTGTQGHSGDGGSAVQAQLAAAYDLAVDGAGNVYFTDNWTNRVRRISADGFISTFAGDGSPGHGGGGGPANRAQLRTPLAVTADAAGNVYIADFGNYQIRKVARDGTIQTIAGNGNRGFQGDGGPALNAALGDCYGIAVDAAGNLYLTHSGVIGSPHVVRLLEPDGPPPVIRSIANAASNFAGAVAPGEIVVLYHSGIGPAQLHDYNLNQAGLVGTQLDRTQVTFNGTPAPLLYTWTTSLAAVVPYSLAGSDPLQNASADVQLTFRGVASEPFRVAVDSSEAALFTAGSSGTGQAAALNEDGSYNSPQNPAKTGSVVTLYATGEGQTSPAGVDGKLGTDPLPVPVLPVRVVIGEEEGELVSAGGALGAVAGLMEVKVRIPSGVSPGDAVPVRLYVDGTGTPQGATIAVAGD